MIRANEVVKTISRNTLYHLRSNHPIVDGVGILSNEINEDWLVFIQISIKQYQNHNANLETLFAEKRGEKGYKELPKNDSALFIFNYYQNLSGFTDESRVLYLYASMSTYCDGDHQVFNKMLAHAQGRCQVGLLSTTATLYKKFVHLTQ